MKNNKAGFTLIELLVVISIIALLSAIVITPINEARTEATDTRRLTDLKAVQTALALYYDTHGSYPNTSGNSCDGDFDDALADLVAEGYISEIPNDPVNAEPLCYKYRIDPASTDNVCGTQDPAYQLYFTSEQKEFPLPEYFPPFTPQQYCLLPAT